MQPDIVPVILAGGEGRRLRPLTAPTRPKPFLKIFSNKSLLQLTMLRVEKFKAPLIVCDARFSDYAQNEVQELDKRARIIAEPMQRGTAAAIVCAALLLQEQNPFMLVMPSDHIIEDAEIFQRCVERAVKNAPEDAPVILGKKPDGPQERYGYIRTHLLSDGLFHLEGFTEKPPLKIARKIYDKPGVFWNTGIFICRARALLTLFSEHAPDVVLEASRSMNHAKKEGDRITPDIQHYKAIPHISIDRAIMERLHRGAVLPLETGWHDVGCWERIFALKFKSLTESLKPRRYESRRSGITKR